jgi:hypothetical protein
MPIIKDLVVDVSDFLDKYFLVKPYLINQDARRSALGAAAEPGGPQEAGRAVRVHPVRLLLQLLPSYWADPNYLGPSALLNVWRFIDDSATRGRGAAGYRSYRQCGGSIRPAAQRLAEKVKTVRRGARVDIVEGVPQGKALDLMEAAPVEKHDATVTGTNSYEDTAGIRHRHHHRRHPQKAGHEPRRSHQHQRRHREGGDREVAKHSPEAVLIIVSNPLDAMCHVAYQASGFPKERVIGMAGVLDSARFRTFIAMELDVSVENTHAFVLGGHGDTMVPLPRYSTVAGIPITELMPEDRIRRCASAPPTAAPRS